MRHIETFELVDHGIDHEQYFQGCGVAFTSYTDVATGIGDNPAEAIDDALEMLAQMGWETEGMEKRILRECFKPKRKLPTEPQVAPHCPKCGDDAVNANSGRRNREKYDRERGACGDYACDNCRYLFDGDEAFGEQHYYVSIRVKGVSE